MKIVNTSVLVDDQDKALNFYTTVLGFVKKTEVPMGQYRWLTVVSTDAPDGVEIVLEPCAFPPAQVFQKALKDAGIPAKMFGVADIQAEYERLTKLGVAFTKGPTPAGPVIIAILDDTCGNLIQIVQFA
jgi:predicted enzyme related to lactoylglutathione lyase